MQDKTAWVTGAASGIGAALVDALIDRGAKVVATDIDEAALKARHGGGRVNELVLERLDVSDGEAIGESLARAKRFGGSLDLVFNNAGIVIGGDMNAMNAADWQRIVDINLWGVIHGTRLAYAMMREQGAGHIANTASMAGLSPVAYSAAYSATKHAVVGLSLSLREEAREHGIGVSVICPGVVDTGIFGSAQDVGGYTYSKLIDKVPGGKTSPADAAKAILCGVERNDARILFPFSSKMLWALGRVAPDLYNTMAGKQMKPGS